MKPKTIFDAIRHCTGEAYFETNRKPEPTRLDLGSPEKIAELRRRLDNAEQLWHEDDYSLAAKPKDVELKPVRFGDVLSAAKESWWNGQD